MCVCDEQGQRASEREIRKGSSRVMLVPKGAEGRGALNATSYKLELPPAPLTPRLFSALLSWLVVSSLSLSPLLCLSPFLACSPRRAAIPVLKYLGPGERAPRLVQRCRFYTSLYSWYYYIRPTQGYYYTTAHRGVSVSVYAVHYIVIYSIPLLFPTRRGERAYIKRHIAPPRGFALFLCCAGVFASVFCFAHFS